MLGIGMAPLFAGLGLCYHTPGGVAAPPGVTSLSPSREGLRGNRGVPPRMTPVGNRPRRCGGVRRGIEVPSGRRSLLQGAGVPGSDANLHPRWQEWRCPGGVGVRSVRHRHGHRARATGAGQEKMGHKRQGSLHEVPPLLTCGGSAECAHILVWDSVPLIPRCVRLTQSTCHGAISIHIRMD